MMRDDATNRQVTAANPFASSWVSANAGSGKTRVLTNRVARMLYQGVAPNRILCLTYTKAAASEMQIRLFETLGGWSMATDEALATELETLGEPGPFSIDDLRRARRMFATAIEAPGGLKIQTIHAFCASVLRRFPLEAGVSPGFREIDDRTAIQLRAQALDMVATNAPAVLDEMARFSPADMDELCAAIIGSADDFQPQSYDGIRALSGVSPDQTEDTTIQTAILGGERALAERVAEIAKGSSAKYQKFAAELAAVNFEAFSRYDFDALCGLCLYSGSKVASKSSNFPQSNHKKAVVAFAPVIEDLHALMDRVAAARLGLNALHSSEKTFALQGFAQAYLDEYQALKSFGGWLDFDDLIKKTLDLLSQSDAAQWVLYRLDGGIDHILVDEAQDTSPVQWEVIERLAAEFTAGDGARDDVARTIFVVGDRKQSIYSFQGAAPDKFDEKKGLFREKLGEIGSHLQSVELSHSFRSSPAILGFVDAALKPFVGQGIGEHLNHIAFQEGKAGRVDLWPLYEATDAKPAKPAFSDPVDVIAADHPARKLAADIASEIAGILARGEQLEGKDGPRPIHPGDFLILVQKRGRLFGEILRRLKAEGLPVAGSDVLKLQEELAVKDLRSFLAFLATPDDDLALAEIMRSPLLGLSEKELFDCAYGRPEGQSLWSAFVRKRPPEDPVRRMLHDLLAIADGLGPFELLDRILGRHEGRKRLLGRLGPECAEAIDALCALALDYEAREIPSLIGFLAWLDRDENRIKRQSDNAGQLIRVMTTHGAKGLEAPIVILPDTGSTRRNNKGDALLEDENGIIWKAAADLMDDRASKALELRKRAEDEERLRLFYVAMTRAENWLILCGAGKANETSWLTMAGDAMIKMDTEDITGSFGIAKRLSHRPWPAPTGKVAPTDGTTPQGLPDWAALPAAPLARPPMPLTPSKIGGAKTVDAEWDGLDAVAAMARGTKIHRLLEILPGIAPPDRARAARTILGPEQQDQDIIDEVLAVLSNPDLSHVFEKNALVEVPITAPIAELGGRRMEGVVDRVIVSGSDVLVVDFKSNAVVPERPADIPQGLLAQMGAYCVALEQIFPDHRISPAILWTKTAALTQLEHDIVRQALLSTAAS